MVHYSGPVLAALRYGGFKIHIKPCLVVLQQAVSSIAKRQDVAFAIRLNGVSPVHDLAFTWQHGPVSLDSHHYDDRLIFQCRSVHFGFVSYCQALSGNGSQRACWLQVSTGQTCPTVFVRPGAMPREPLLLPILRLLSPTPEFKAATGWHIYCYLM